MPAPLVIHFVRHGEVHNPEKILYGRLPNFYLSDNGRQQAQATAQFLANRAIHTIYASPMERAQETAQIIAQGHPTQHTVKTDERLIEVLTPYEGHPLAELEKIQFELYHGNEPPYEHPQDIRARTLHFIHEARAQHAHEEIVAVTHGDTVVTMFMYAVGQDATSIGRGRLEGWGLPERYPATAGVLTLSFHTDQPDEVPAWQYTRPY